MLLLRMACMAGSGMKLRNSESPLVVGIEVCQVCLILIQKKDAGFVIKATSKPIQSVILGLQESIKRVLVEGRAARFSISPRTMASMLVPTKFQLKYSSVLAQPR